MTAYSCIVNLGLKSMRAAVFDDAGNRHAIAYRPIESRMGEGRVEQDPEDWWRATGAALDAPRIAKANDPRLKHFRAAFNAVLANLAEQVARDGEGARKLVEIKVEGATSDASARRIAMSIANSPLVKTAIAGEDANWGRVVMAVGKAGERADRDRLSIWFGGIRVAHKGERDPAYDEAEVSAAMKKPEITLKVALGLGKGRDRVLTCDLTKEYVAINGDYRS